jgi:hypothetical protein
MSQGSAYRHNTNNGSTDSYPTVPGDAVVVGNGTFLTPGGDVYFENRGIIVSGVSSAWSEYTVKNYQVTYVADGMAGRYESNTGKSSTFASVPAGSTVIGNEAFIAAGAIYWRNTHVDDGVTSAFSEFTNALGGENRQITYMTGGTARLYNTKNGERVTFANVPADSTTIGNHAFITPSKELFFGNKNIASGVTSAYSKYTAQTAGNAENFQVTYTT